MISGICGCYGALDPACMSIVAATMKHRGAYESMYAGERVILASISVKQREDAGSLDVPLVFSGHITNWSELRALTAQHEACIGEHRLLWSLYRQFGVAGFERINGPFSIALFDVESRSLIVAVDRWSTQPLHLAQLNQGWLFATDYKALAACLPERATVNPRAVREVVSSKYLSLHSHLDSRVAVVGPGEYVRIGDGGCSHASYQPLSLDIDSDLQEEQELAAELRVHLLRAADRLTRAHDVVAVGVSGGLDSTLTLGAVRRVAPHKRIIAYTACADERDPAVILARESAQYFGAEHRVVIVHPAQLARWLPELVWRMEDPVAREEMLVYHVLAQESAQEAAIMMYGHMADVLFGGMPRHLLIRAASQLPIMRHPLIEFYDYTQTGSAPHSWLGRVLVAGYFRGHSTTPPPVVGAQNESGAKQLEIESEQPLNAALLKSLAQPTEVSAMERLHAWAGIEMASIFHDRDVSRCAFRIPDHLKIRGRTRKHILRVAAEGILPAEFARRPKDLVRMGRNPAWRRELLRLADDLLSSDVARRRGIFEIDAIDNLCQRVNSQQGTDQDLYHLWSVMLVELWSRIYTDGYIAEAGPTARMDLRPDLLIARQSA